MSTEGKGSIEEIHGLAKPIHQDIKEKAGPIIGLCASIIEAENVPWSASALLLAATKFENTQEYLERHNLRRTQAHYDLVNMVSMLKHLSYTMFAPLHAQQRLSSGSLGCIDIEEQGRRICLDDELGAIAQEFKEPLIAYARILLHACEEYGFFSGEVPKQYSGRVRMEYTRASPEITASIPVSDILPVPANKEEYDTAMSRILHRVKKANTILSSHFDSRLRLDANFCITGENLPCPGEDGSDVGHGLTLDEIAIRLSGIPYRQALFYLMDAREIYDNSVANTVQESQSVGLAEVPKLCEASIVQLDVLDRCLHLYLRHVRKGKELYPTSYSRLVNLLQLDETPNRLQRSLILTAMTSTVLAGKTYGELITNVPERLRVYQDY